MGFACAGSARHRRGIQVSQSFSTTHKGAQEMRDVFVAREIALRQGWLSHTPAAFQSDVLDRCVLQEIESGARLFAEGVPVGDMYGVVAGQLAVWIAHGRRNPRLVHFLRPGSWFESFPPFTSQGLRVSLSASRDVKVLCLPQQAMQEIADLHPEAWRLFALVSAGYVRVATLAADDLLIRDHVKRCIAVLLRLGGCRVVTPPTSTPIDVDLNQQGLATLSNLARTTAGQILRKLEESGHLEVSYRHIRILAPDALRAMLAE